MHGSGALVLTGVSFGCGSLRPSSCGLAPRSRASAGCPARLGTSGWTRSAGTCGLAPRCLKGAKTARKAGKGKGKGKPKDPPAKKKNKRGTRSAKATAKRIERGQAKRLASAQERAEEEESTDSAGEPEGQGSSSAAGPARRVVFTYTAAEAKAKAKAVATASSKSRAKGSSRAVSVEGPTDRPKYKKERKRRRRRSACPRVTLKSVEREPRPLRLRSVAPAVRKARERADELKVALGTAKQQWAKGRFRDRVAIQEGIRTHLPKGSVGESIRRKAGLAEACSSCDERGKLNRPAARRRVLTRFSAAQLKQRVEETLKKAGKPALPKAKKVEEEEEEEEDTSPDPGFEPDFDPPTSPDVGPGAGSVPIPAIGTAA